GRHAHARPEVADAGALAGLRDRAGEREIARARVTGPAAVRIAVARHPVRAIRGAPAETALHADAADATDLLLRQDGGGPPDLVLVADHAAPVGRRDDMGELEGIGSRVLAELVRDAVGERRGLEGVPERGARVLQGAEVPVRARRERAR